MNKDQIIQSLQTNHQQFADAIQSLSAQDFMYRKEGKWTAGQHADHIVRSVSPVAMAFGLPRLIPKLMFGKSNRSSKNYE